MLEGELTVKLGPDGDETVAPAGTLVRIPPLVVHGFRNGSDAEVRYLNFHAPGEGFADYMRGLSDFDQDEPPEDGGRPASEASVSSGGGHALRRRRDRGHRAERRRATTVHAHGEHVESLYVLEGELALTAGDREVRARAGTWLQIPAGMTHRVSGPARYLEVHTPA